MDSENRIQYQCPYCDKMLFIHQKYAGQWGKCKHCGNVIEVPVLNAPEQTTPGEDFEPQDRPTIKPEPIWPTVFGWDINEHSVTVKTAVVIIACIVMLFVFRSTCTGCRAACEPAEQKAELAEREAMRAMGFSYWDGRNTNVVEAVKRRMHNPNSFKHDRTTFAPIGGGNDNMLIMMIFQGTNAFGGVVTQTAIAEITPNGRVVNLRIE